jgi:competence protein ComEA
MMDGTDPPRADDARLAFAVAAALLAAALGARLAAAQAGAADGRFDRWRVDVNAAPAGEVEALPGVGPVLAARIVAERARAAFESADDLLRVPGVGPTTLERLRPFVRCSHR